MNHSPENTLMPAITLNHGLTSLTNWGLILVEGSDAATLLQGQLSNSVVSLKRTLSGEAAQGPGAVRLVGYCNPKGRLLASAWLALFPESADSEDRFALFISKDIAASTAKRLAMYVLRSKVKVLDASNDWDVFASYQNSQGEQSIALPSDVLALRMPDVLAQGPVQVHRACAMREHRWEERSIARLESFDRKQIHPSRSKHPILLPLSAVRTSPIV